MPKQTMESASLPGKASILLEDKVRYHKSSGEESEGVVARFWDAGEYGWMTVLDKSGQYECVSIAVQIGHYGAGNIVIKD